MTNGEDDFESRGFTDSYETDTISVQRVVVGPICVFDISKVVLGVG